MHNEHNKARRIKLKPKCPSRYNKAAASFFYGLIHDQFVEEGGEVITYAAEIETPGSNFHFLSANKSRNNVARPVHYR